MGINSVIFYFSQSGNTEKIAEKIGEALNTGENKCTLVKFSKLKEDIKTVNEFNFSNFDLIGIGTPVYYFHPPFHILEIIKNFPRLKGYNGFLFCTSGGNPGSTLHRMKITLDKKGLKIIDGNDQFFGLDKHQFYRDFDYYYPPSVNRHIEEGFNNAYRFGKGLIKKMLSRNTHEKTDFWKRDSLIARLLTYEMLNKEFPKFKIRTEKCNKCGICAEICPVDSIVMDPYPKWNVFCDRCYICEIKCPENAIECDWDWMVEFMNGLLKKRGYFPIHKKKINQRKKISIMFKKMRVLYLLLKLKLRKKSIINS
ncbi:MAG: EFR1 family ferrodoxin [Promethearchaeota archaeon]